MSLFRSRDRETTTYRRLRASARFRPCVDGLEGRALLSTASLPAALVSPITAQQTVPVFSVDTARDRLLATVTLNGQTVTVPVDPQPLPTPAGQPQRLLLRVDAVTQN